MSLEHLVTPNGREVLKDEVLANRCKSPFKKAPPAKDGPLLTSIRVITAMN